MNKLQFSTVADVTMFFQGWHDYDESLKLQILRQLRDLGKIAPLTSKPSQDVSKCPKYGFALSRPCGLSKCQFHMNSPETKNCVINCLNNSKANRLTANEVSSITRLSLTEVNEVTQKSVCKIKKAILKEKVDRITLVRYQFLAGHCINCEMSIFDDLEMGINPELIFDADSQYGWCSPECKASFAGWKFKIEKEFNCNYLDVLAIACFTVQAKPGNQKDLTQRIAEILEIEPSQITPVWDKMTKRASALL